MKYGSKLEFFYNVEAEGGYIPALDTRPKLHDDLVADFNIFHDLSKSRQWDGMSGTPHSISFSEIEAYLRLHEVDDQTQKIRLINRLSFMDQIYCDYHRKKHGGHTDNTGSDRGNKRSKSS